MNCIPSNLCKDPNFLPNKVFVKPSAQNAGDGTSWSNATSLQQYLTSHPNGENNTVLLLEEGTHVFDHTVSLYLVDKNMQIVGGMTDPETNPEKRSCDATKTIISANTTSPHGSVFQFIYLNGLSTLFISSVTFEANHNSHHPQSLIHMGPDGFPILSCNAVNISEWVIFPGLNTIVSDANASIVWCNSKFQTNQNQKNVIYSKGKTVWNFDNVQFAYSQTNVNDSCLIKFENESYGYFINCQFYRNISIGNAAVLEINNDVIGNFPTITTIVNCSVVANQNFSGDGTASGAVFVNGNANVKVCNSIFWNNVANIKNFTLNDQLSVLQYGWSLFEGGSTPFDSIYFFDSSQLVLAGGSPPVGILDPMFVNDTVLSGDFDLRLKSTSPAINAGNNSCLLLTMCPEEVETSEKLWVSFNGTGIGNGSNAANSLSLTNAINMFNNPMGSFHELWLLNGIYTISAQIILQFSGKLYGGFDGSETYRSQRNNVSFQALNGSLGTKFRLTNSFPNKSMFLVDNSTMGINIVLDGIELDANQSFTGNVDTTAIECARLTSNLLIRNMHIHDFQRPNGSAVRVGDTFSMSMTPGIDNTTIICNCLIENNTDYAPQSQAQATGGIIQIFQNASIVNTVVRNNFGPTEDSQKISNGLYVAHNATIYNCVFSNNNSSPSQPNPLHVPQILFDTTQYPSIGKQCTIVNSTVIDSTSGCGISLTANSSVSTNNGFCIRNCIVSGNKGTTPGYTFNNISIFDTFSTYTPRPIMYLQDNLIGQDSVGGNQAQLLNSGFNTFLSPTNGNVNNSILSDNVNPTPEVSNVNPLYSPTPSSLSITDSGDNIWLVGLPLMTTDLYGNTRIFSGVVDRGAVETISNVRDLSNPNAAIILHDADGNPRIVDNITEQGSYEVQCLFFCARGQISQNGSVIWISPDSPSVNFAGHCITTNDCVFVDGGQCMSDEKMGNLVTLTIVAPYIGNTKISSVMNYSCVDSNAVCLPGTEISNNPSQWQFNSNFGSCFEVLLCWDGSVIPCVHGDTLVLTKPLLQNENENSVEIPIRDLRKGDLVFTSLGMWMPITYNIRIHTKGSDFVQFPKSSLGENIPSSTLLIRKGHPILDQNGMEKECQLLIDAKQGICEKQIHFINEVYTLALEPREGVFVNMQGVMVKAWDAIGFDFYLQNSNEGRRLFCQKL